LAGFDRTLRGALNSTFDTAGGIDRKLPHDGKSLVCFLAPVSWLAVFCEIGRARRGASGTLYSQSATARLNSFPRVGSAEPLPP